MTVTARFAAALAITTALTVIWAFSPNPVLHKGLSLMQQKARCDDAVARLDTALARLRARAERRDDDWLTREQLAAGYLERARMSGDWQDFRRAELELERAFARAPAGAGPHLTRATLHHALHRYARAEADLEAVEAYAVIDADTRRAARALRADVYLATGRYREARALYEALLAESRARDALVGMGNYLWQTGDRGEADALLAEAETASSGADALTRAWLCLTRGMLAADDGRLDDARAHYRRGRALMPSWYVIDQHVAELLVREGEIDRALAIYRALIDRTGDPALMDAAAELLTEQGEHAEASELFARAHAAHEARIRMYPEAARGHALGHFHAHEGDEARAIELARR